MENTQSWDNYVLLQRKMMALRIMLEPANKFLISTIIFQTRFIINEYDGDNDNNDWESQDVPIRPLMTFITIV